MRCRRDHAPAAGDAPGEVPATTPAAPDAAGEAGTAVGVGAAVAVGADGLIVEVHPAPEKAVSDGAQSLKPEKFYQLMDELRSIATAMRH